MQERDYLRVRIPGLRVHYGILSEIENTPLYLGFGRKLGPPLMEGFKEADAFQKLVISSIHRLEVKLDRLIGYLEREKEGTSYQYQSEVLNISGGGVSLRSATACPVGTLLDLCIFARSGDPQLIFAIGRVCWITRHTDEAVGSSQILGVEFTEINEEDRDSIVRMVFQMERKQRQIESRLD